MEAGLWFYEYEGRKIGPIPTATLLHLARHGAIHRQSRVWQDDASERVLAETVKDLFEPVTESAHPSIESQEQETSWLNFEPKSGLSSAGSSCIFHVTPYEDPAGSRGHHLLDAIPGVGDSDVGYSDLVRSMEQLSRSYRTEDIPRDARTKHSEGMVAGIRTREYHSLTYRASQILPSYENALEKVMERSLGVRVPPGLASAQLQRDILVLLEAVVRAESARELVSDLFSILEPDTVLIDLGSDEAKSNQDDPPLMVDATVEPIVNWERSLEDPCLSVRHLTQYDACHGTSLAESFIAFASQCVDLLAQAPLLGEDDLSNKERVLAWMYRSCRMEG
jgi:hypothetical protein